MKISGQSFATNFIFVRDYLRITTHTRCNANALISCNYHPRMNVAVVPTDGGGGWRGLIAPSRYQRVFLPCARRRHGISITVREALPVTCPCYVYVTHYRHGAILSSLRSWIRARSYYRYRRYTFGCARKAILPERRTRCFAIQESFHFKRVHYS